MKKLLFRLVCTRSETIVGREQGIYRLQDPDGDPAGKHWIDVMFLAPKGALVEGKSYTVTIKDSRNDAA